MPSEEFLSLASKPDNQIYSKTAKVQTETNILTCFARNDLSCTAHVPLFLHTKSSALKIFHAVKSLFSADSDDMVNSRFQHKLRCTTERPCN